MNADTEKRAGSMTELPKGLLEASKVLEDHLTVPASKLKEITHHFISELDKGRLHPGRLHTVVVG